MLPNLIIPVLNRYDLLTRLLRSIDYPIRDLVIIDNGYGYRDLYGKPMLLGAKRVTVLPMPGNLGVAASWNLGIKLLPHDDRWFFASNDMAYAPGSLKILSEARSDELTIAEDFPHWHTFALGEDVVRRVGLFDEGYYPAYYEDTDYLWRLGEAGAKLRRLSIPAIHDNSSTLHSDERFMEANKRTFQNNQNYHRAKKAGEIPAEDQGWSLDRRRANAW